MVEQGLRQIWRGGYLKKTSGNSQGATPRSGEDREGGESEASPMKQELEEKDRNLREKDAKITNQEKRIAELEKELEKARSAVRPRGAQAANGVAGGRTKEQVLDSRARVLNKVKNHAAKLGSGVDEAKELMERMEKFKESIMKW